MASAKRVLDRRDVQSALRHFVFPAVSGGVDAAVQLITPIVEAWQNMQPTPPFSVKQAVGVVGHAALVAAGAAIGRAAHRWWIDLRAKMGIGADATVQARLDRRADQ